MSSYVIKLPDVGEGIAEAEIVAWHVNVGDTIGEDDPIVEVMTDKATVELPSPVSGRIVRLGAEIGDLVPVGSDLIWIDLADHGGGQGAAANPDDRGDASVGGAPAAPEGVVVLASESHLAADMQPAWLYKDSASLMKTLGEKRMKLFLPLKTWFDKGLVIGGGSDHMVKLDFHGVEASLDQGTARDSGVQ